jgi:hypothetical protein
VRGCLAFVVFAAVLVGALAFAIVRFALPSLVESAVRGSPLVHGQPLTVVTDASFAGVFLGGRIDAIEVNGRDLTEPDAEIGTFALTLRDVSLLDRAFGSADGRLSNATLVVGNGQRLTVDTVALSGSGTTLTATLDVSATAAEALIRTRLETVGVPIEAVHLGVARIDIRAAGQAVDTTLLVGDAGLALDAGALGTVPIVEAPASGEWRIQAIDVRPTGIHLVVLISLR